MSDAFEMSGVPSHKPSLLYTSTSCRSLIAYHLRMLPVKEWTWVRFELIVDPLLVAWWIDIHISYQCSWNVSLTLFLDDCCLEQWWWSYTTATRQVCWLSLRTTLNWLIWFWTDGIIKVDSGFRNHTGLRNLSFHRLSEGYDEGEETPKLSKDEFC